MNCVDNYINIKNSLPDYVRILAVSKTKPESLILQLYEAGHRDFGENKVQELLSKYNNLPKDIRWHLIGHLQTNKVKYIVPFVYMIQSVDSKKLLEEINKRAIAAGVVVKVLLQPKIAEEETKTGFSIPDLDQLFRDSDFINSLSGVKICGLMAVATDTDDQEILLNEFGSIKTLFDKIKNNYFASDNDFKIISEGMSGDYPIAVKAGSNMVRIGSTIFGTRDYSKVE